MKTRSKSLLVLGFLGTLLVGYLLGLLVNFPSLNEQELAGTVGKANKYRKTVLTAEDVQLRSDLLKDTAKLKTMVQGLTYFSLAAEETGRNLDLALLAFRSKGMGADELEEKQLGLLADYSDFLRNGNQNLTATLSMLSAMLFEGEAAQTPDVDKNLRNFSNFVAGMDKWSSVFSQGLLDLDQFLLSSEGLKSMPLDLTELKSLRDVLLVSGLQLGAMARCNSMVNSVMNVLALANEQLGTLQSMDKLNVIMSDGSQLLKAGSRENLLGNALVYNANEQLFVIMGREQLGYVESRPELQVIALLGQETLNLLLPAIQMRDLAGSGELLRIFSTEQLNLVFGTQLDGLIFNNVPQAVGALNFIM